METKKSSVERTTEEQLEAVVREDLTPIKWGIAEKLIVAAVVVLTIVNLFLNLLSLGPDLY